MNGTITLYRAGVLACACCALVAASVGAGGEAAPKEQVAVARVLDDWHAAAAAADEKRYFDHFAPEAIFLGTEAGERWSVDEFRAYAHPHFARGSGWTYLPSQRHVTTSADRSLAWFDEMLHSEKYGALRGTGVLRRVSGEWKIVHYSMTFTIPNDLTAQVVALIRND